MKIISYDEYQKIDHETPYVLVLRGDAVSLYFFGERHSFNPDDAEWVQMKELWNTFISETKDKKRIALVEGGVRDYKKAEGKTMREMILRDGGMGLVAYLAGDVGIEVHSPEPDHTYERSELEKEFSREQIQFYYFARVVHQWCRHEDPKPDFEKYINRFLKRDSQASGWTDFDFSLDSMKSVYHKFFQTAFNERDKDFWYSIVNPIDQTTVTNKISRRSGEIRDEYMLQEIERYIREGYSIFGQFGASHVVRQEPVLREYLKV